LAPLNQEDKNDEIYELRKRGKMNQDFIDMQNDISKVCPICRTDDCDEIFNHNTLSDTIAFWCANCGTLIDQQDTQKTYHWRGTEK